MTPVSVGGRWRGGAQRRLGQVGVVLTDALYPRRCAGCRWRGTWLCGDCESSLAMFREPWCAGCGIPPAVGACRCDDRSPSLGAVRSAGPFAGWLRAAIADFKYHGEWARAAHLAAFLAAVVDGMGGVDGLIAVPLHPSRLRRRGYNQSALLAREAGILLGLPTIAALRRTRPTPQQVGLTAIERQQNVRGAFVVTEPDSVRDLRLILVDDVVTTGSTLGECATALAAGGAGGVRAATLAREV